MDADPAHVWAKMLVKLTVSMMLMGGIWLYSKSGENAYEHDNAARRLYEELEIAQQGLKEVMKHKQRSDKLLADMQEYRRNAKDRFDSILEGCFVLTQSSVVCQKRLAALKLTCKKTEIEYEKIKKRLNDLKRPVTPTTHPNTPKLN